MLLRLFCIAILLQGASLYAQDNSNLSHYFMNPYVINPSFAGTDGRPSIFLNYRMQWAGIDGAPTIANASFHTPLGNMMGLGVNINNFQRGVLNTTSAIVSNAVGIKLTDKFILRFGASVGAASNTVDMDVVNSGGVDPNILDDIAADQNTYLVGNAGVSLQAKNFNFGISIPNLFTDELYTTESFTVGEVSPLEHLLIFASNRFYLTRKKMHIIEPFILYRYSDVLPAQLEASLLVHLNHTVWFGGSYKQDFGLTALAGLKLNKVFGLGYAYSLPNSGNDVISSSTHEVQLNLLLGGRKDKRLVYSFVDSELPKKKSKRQLAMEERRKKLEEQKKQAAEEALAKKQAEEEESAKAEAQAQKRAEDEAAKKAQSERLAQAAAQQNEQEAARQQALELEKQRQLAAVEEERKREQQRLEEKREEERQQQARQDEMNRQAENSQKETQPDRTPSNRNLVESQTTNERVVVRRGGHLLELQEGEYVIAGVFESYEHAEQYSDELFFKGYQSKFGYISQSGYWYVYVHETNSIDAARAKRDELRKTNIFKKAWVLTVE